MGFWCSHYVHCQENRNFKCALIADCCELGWSVDRNVCKQNEGGPRAENESLLVHI